MDVNNKAPSGVTTLERASNNNYQNYYTTEPDDSSTSLGFPTPDGTNPANASIILGSQRCWGRREPPSRLRHIRLNAPENCTVEGCNEPAYCAPQVFKFYPGRGTFCGGIHQSHPFLCRHHHQEDKRAAGRNRYTDTGGWATRVIYRLLLPPLGRFDEEVT